jgi:hypothetical protein
MRVKSILSVASICLSATALIISVVTAIYWIPTTKQPTSTGSPSFRVTDFFFLLSHTQLTTENNGSAKANNLKLDFSFYDKTGITEGIGVSEFVPELEASSVHATRGHLTLMIPVGRIQLEALWPGYSNASSFGLQIRATSNEVWDVLVANITDLYGFRP